MADGPKQFEVLLGTDAYAAVRYMYRRASSDSQVELPSMALPQWSGLEETDAEF